MPWFSFFECWVLNQLLHSPPFTFIKRLFRYFSLSATRVMSSAYLRLLILFLVILILACASSSLAFFMMYSECKLNKQGDNIYIQRWHTLFPILNQSIVSCLVLTIVFWPVYRLHRKQVRWSGILISKNFPLFAVIHTVKRFSIVNEAEVDVFLEFSCFFYNPRDVSSLISGSSAFSKSILNIW